MKKTIIYFLMFYSCVVALAQKPDTLTATLRQATTPEQVLGLPAAYTVLKCDITVSISGEILRFFYAKDGSRWCVNANASNFSKLWGGIAPLATKGAKIIVDGIIVQKGDKEMKWRLKTFIVP